MSGFYSAALKAMHVALSSSLRFMLTLSLQFVDTIKCKTNPDLINFKV
jgi:hypothetical protein